MERVTKLASQRAVVIFSTSSCCMCHTIKRLFCELGCNPAVYELDEEPKGREMEKALAKLLGRKPPVPTVFIGGRLVGSTDRGHDSPSRRRSRPTSPGSRSYLAVVEWCKSACDMTRAKLHLYKWVFDTVDVN